jgi:hypothetical protein
MTIAYVKKGEGKKYQKTLEEPLKYTFDIGVYSDHPNGNIDKSKKHKLKLTFNK